MSNSERKHPRKPEHPRTLAYRDQYETYDYYGDNLERIICYMNSQNTNHFGSDPGHFPTNVVKYRWVSIYENHLLCLGILKYGFEEEVHEYYDYKKEVDSLPPEPWDTFYDKGNHTFEEESPFKFFFINGICKDEKWTFDLHVHSSLQPIICHAMTHEIYTHYYSRTYGSCYDCHGEIGYMGGQCADCYWEEDAARKSRRRAFYSYNPDLHAAWAAHCRHTFYPNEPIEVPDLLCKYIPTTISVDSPEYTTYLEKFKLAIVGGMTNVMNLLKEINPDYEPAH